MTFDSKPVEKSPAQASHDTLNPPKLVEFMLTGWKAPSRRKVARVRGHERFALRRQRLSALFPGETLLVPTGHEKVRANDTTYRFRPGSDFYYLTGNQEPDCVLALVPRASGGHEALLFVEPNPGRSSPTFFTDRSKGELWVGPRLGVDESRERYQVDRCVGLPELPAFLKRLGPGAQRLVRGLDPELEQQLPARKKEDRELATVLSELRLVKDSLEVAALERAIRATRHAFEDVVQRLGRLKSEREIEGIFNLRARVEGNDVGYGTIAAAGANATILHWTRNDGAVRKGDLLLLDAGVEGDELYTADVTRTLPISGKFSAAQREIYELVLAAQAAAYAEVRPGRDFMAPHRAAMVVLAHGLHELGILKVAPEEALKDELQLYKRYSLHNVSHMLGIDVHDCALARAESYKYGALVPGMVLTVEPGLYFQPDDLTVPAKYRGIGVRIEDDVLVTRTGCRILTSDFPSAAKDVERWVKRARG
ncbi:MAG: aminopeptidase P family protein [Deltaproteobacteria bacterium]